MFFDEIIHGTQYYRSPTPLPEEWEGDIAALGDAHLDTFQIRINWRWNERQEGVYDFSDVDRLMDLAEKYNRKVIIKFLLECAPQYVFEEFEGARIGPRGEQLRGGSHGAFYGGWRPCFTNPHVQAAAKRFVEKVAERYAGRKNLILWNAWNEIRNRPIEDCFCKYCRAGYGKYLQKKFGTVEKLNAFYGVAEDSFETIALPAMPHGYWDIYEFKKYKGSAELYDWLRFVYEGVRKYDKERPIMAHVGFTSAFQLSISDVCDDYEVSKAVDFWGTSIPCDTEMRTHEQRLDFMMLHDFLRSVDKNYFIHEIYPGLGMFKYKYDTPFDMEFKTYASLAGGAKGMVYWQYRAERLGHEQDCAGLVRMDGSPRPVLQTVGDFGADLKKNMQYLAGAEVKDAEVAIVFDFNSMLLSEIEDACGADFSFEFANPQFYYRNAHAGMYRLLRNSDYAVDYVSASRPEEFAKYKVLYFPYYTMLDPQIVPHLEAFVAGGGTILADEGFGMRRMNTWMQPYDIACKPLFTARMTERRMVAEEFVEIDGELVRIRPYRTFYRHEGGEAVATWRDGSSAVQKYSYGKGKVYLFGFSIGYSYHDTHDQRLASFAQKLLAEAGVEKNTLSDTLGGIYEKRLVNGSYEVIHLFNNTDAEKGFDLKKTIVAVGGHGCVQEGKAIVPAGSMAYFVVEKDS